MPIEFEYYLLTGTVGGPSDALLNLKHTPISGATGIIVDPIQGPPQKAGVDWGLTGSNLTYNLSGSTIREIRESYIREHGVESSGPALRVIYEY